MVDRVGFFPYSGAKSAVRQPNAREPDQMATACLPHFPQRDASDRLTDCSRWIHVRTYDGDGQIYVENCVWRALPSALLCPTTKLV